MYVRKEMKESDGQTVEVGPMGMRIEVGEGKMGGEWAGKGARVHNV